MLHEKPARNNRERCSPLERRWMAAVGEVRQLKTVPLDESGRASCLVAVDRRSDEMWVCSVRAIVYGGVT